MSEVIMGQVLTAGQGQNPARQASINAGIPKEVPAYGVNQVCGSGLRAVALGYQSLITGDADVVIAGGQENMSLSPHCQMLRAGQKMGDMKMVDTMVYDGLTDVFNQYHMGMTAGIWPRSTRSAARRRTALPSGRRTLPKRRAPMAVFSMRSRR